MKKNIKVSLEAFGNKRLTVSLRPEEVEGKSVGEIVNAIVNSSWQGEDQHALAIIKQQVNASGGYTPSIEVGGTNLPVRAQPIKLGDKIDRYVEDYGQTERRVTVSVTGEHVVGHPNIINYQN